MPFIKRELKSMKIACLIAQTLLLVVALLSTMAVKAQDAAPVIKFTTVDEEGEATDVEMSPGDSQTAQAPLHIFMTANVEDEGQFEYVSEWRVYNSDKGEDEAIVTRFTDDTDYTLTKSGGYGVKLFVTFVSQRGDTIEYESEPFNIVISESKLTCPDGFSPNGDGINDVFRVKYQSIVKLQGAIFNRWGKKLHTFTLDNLDAGWDGRQGGNYVKDGVYFLNIDATGSDGLHYKIKKAINVLKGFSETDEGGTEE